MGEPKIEDFIPNDEEAGTLDAKKVSMMNGIIMMNELPKINSTLKTICALLGGILGIMIGEMLGPLVSMLLK